MNTVNSLKTEASSIVALALSAKTAAANLVTNVGTASPADTEALAWKTDADSTHTLAEQVVTELTNLLTAATKL